MIKQAKDRKWSRSDVSGQKGAPMQTQFEKRQFLYKLLSKMKLFMKAMMQVYT